jgi:hypothetical protein
VRAMTTNSAQALTLEFRVAPDGRAFSLHRQGEPGLGWTGLGGAVEVNGQTLALSNSVASPVSISTGTGSDRTYLFRCLFPETGLLWQWHVSVRPLEVVVVAHLLNGGSSPVSIGPWHVLSLAQGDCGADTDCGADVGSGAMALGAGGARATFFRWCPWDMRVERLGSGSGQHTSDNLCHLHDPATGTTLLSGFTTLDRMGGSHTVACDASGAVTAYRATCAFGTYVLLPGCEIASEALRLSIHADPYAALEAWAETIYHTYKPVLPELPPVSWIGGSWCDANSPREGSWETVALANAAAIRERLRGFDVRYIWTSQSNLKDAIPGNWLTLDELQIPSGLEGFFGKLRELGFLPGLWVAPFWFYSEAEGMLEENRENLLRDAGGVPICHTGAWGWKYDDDLPWYVLHQYFLDGTHPKSAAFLRKIFGTYHALGVRYYMLDFLGIVADSRLHDLAQTPLQAGRAMLQVIRDTAGPDTHIQTAVSSTAGYIGLIDAARVGRDFGEGRPLQGVPLSDWRNATYVLHDLHYANLPYLLQNVAANYFTHRKLYLNDFNLLTIDKPVPLEHARIAVTVFGLGGGSPLMLGDDYRRIDPERLRMVKCCLPRTRDSVRPADLFDRVHPDDYCRILTLPVKTEWESYLLVAAFNLDDQLFETDLDFAQLGLDGAASHRVFEFWNEDYVGTFKERVACAIPPNACRLYRIAPARSHPWLLGTDLHVQQGAVEVTALAWDPDRMRLSGTVSRPKGESGNLFILMPRKMRLINHEGVGLLKELIDLNVILRVPVTFAESMVAFELFFEPWELGYVAPLGLLPYATEAEWREFMRQTGRGGETRVYE